MSNRPTDSIELSVTGTTAYSLTNHIEDFPADREGLPLTLGSSHVLVDLTYRNCKERQHVRECAQNSIEAGAQEVRIEPDWIELRKLEENN